MTLRQQRAQQQVQAAYSALTSGARSLRDILVTDLRVEDWEPVYESLAFLDTAADTEEEAARQAILLKHDRLVKTVAQEEAATTSKRVDYLLAIKSKLSRAHGVYMLARHEAIALEHFTIKEEEEELLPPTKKPRRQRDPSGHDAATWFSSILHRALLKRDFKIAFDFAFPGSSTRGAALGVDSLLRAYARIGQQRPPSKHVLEAMLRHATPTASSASPFDALFNAVLLEEEEEE